MVTPSLSPSHLPRSRLFFRAITPTRALRTLRAARRIESVQVVVEALFLAIPAVGNVALVAALFFFIFVVLGVHMLQGQMSMCVSSGGTYLDPYYFLPAGQNVNKTW
jgi:hypothetical protein